MQKTAHHGIAGHNGAAGHQPVGHQTIGHEKAGHERVENHGRTDKSNDTGLLTRCVPQSLKHSKIYKLWLRLTRILQFLSAVISLGIFSSRVYKVYRLVNSFKAQRGIDRSSAAVEGILAAAVLYTILATIMMCLLRGGGPKILRWLFVLLDIIFVILFIVVAVLTRPNGGNAGPRHCYGSRNAEVDGSGRNANDNDQSCNLPWGTFILAIISTILHATTAAFNEVRDHYRRDKHALNDVGDNHAHQGRTGRFGRKNKTSSYVDNEYNRR